MYRNNRQIIQLVNNLYKGEIEINKIYLENPFPLSTNILMSQPLANQNLTKPQKASSQSPQSPFHLEPISTTKKKSKVSEAMKEKRKFSQKTKRPKKKNHQDQASSSQDNTILRQPLQIQPPAMFDNINYVALEQFQGVIEDKMMLQGYAKAIKENAHLFQGKIVLHLTSGCNCFYSIFAAQAGAAKVYCVLSGHSRAEQANIWMIEQIVKQNNFSEQIEVKSFKDFNAQVDIIIGEPMGYCMYYDGMLDRIIEARDLYLDKKNGLIFPNRLKFKCCLIHDEHFYDKKVQFWNEVYGIPMTSMKKWISHQPIVKVVDPTLMISEIVRFIDLDLYTIKYEQITQSAMDFTIEAYSEGIANGLTIWFQIQFTEGHQPVKIKASPWQEDTKFTHVTLYTQDKIHLKQKQKVNVKMYAKKYPKQGVTAMRVNVGDMETVYTFS